jgi:hypothetical protein
MNVVALSEGVHHEGQVGSRRRLFEIRSQSDEEVIGFVYVTPFFRRDDGGGAVFGELPSLTIVRKAFTTKGTKVHKGNLLKSDHRVMTRLLDLSTQNRFFGGMTVVALYSVTMAGPE